MKPNSPKSTALLKHYVEKSGDLYRFDEIPSEWQDWIVKAIGKRPGIHRDLNPYNSNIFDLRNSLGHFDVKVTLLTTGKAKYEILDVYQFGFIPNDKTQKGRHGFPLGELSEVQLKAARALLPSTDYHNPGGFNERWEIKAIGKETMILIPQQVLAEQGKPFKVEGSFER